ncbi:MAG: glycosyltransferase family 2 protein [Alphaproteobacteria bacterium]|nr:glycosyltransferase family 2 protein [Alphaproteobacteria bacterium]
MITVIVPVHNEQDNIIPLLEELTQAAQSASVTEIIYIDDASTDKTFEILKDATHNFPLLRILRHNVKSGQSAAFLSGVRAAQNPVIVLMDGDGQNNPADIPKLYAEYEKHAATSPKLMVAGQREKRHDNALRRISSILANKIRSFILQDTIRDTGCSLKLIRREDYMRLPYFNHMHRFLPALLMRDHVTILTADVSHRPRERGQSKYGFWDRLWVGISDLVGVRWLLFRGLPKNFEVKDISNDV